MPFLHPELWRELAPHFEARKLLLAAEGALAEAVDDATAGRPLKAVREAIKVLHPCTHQQGAIDEYEARLSGTYEPPQGSTGERRTPRVDPRDSLIKDLQARLDVLEAKGSEEKADPKKKADKPSDTKAT